MNRWSVRILRRTTVVLVWLAVVHGTGGCGTKPMPPGKYFSGKPVEHWLEAIRAADPQTRKRAADVLGNVGPIDPRSVPALAAALADQDARVRDAAVLGLSKLGPFASAATEAVENATRDSDPRVRDHAVKALPRLRERP